MQEIEFRAWDIARKVMMYADCDKNWRGDKDEWYGDNVGMVLNAIKDVQKREKVILLQYTGLKDKNGKKIFEGDIVNVFSFDPDPRRYLVELPDFFESKGFSEMELGENWDAKNLEIIGNVYEKPELLEGI